MNNFKQKHLKKFLFLSDSELIHIKNISRNQRLPYAILLKWFQKYYYFPSQKKDIPNNIIRFMANQLSQDIKNFEEYKWNSRTYRWHCANIRDYLGYKLLTKNEVKNLREWLRNNILLNHNNYKYVYESFLAHIASLKLVCNSDREIKKIISSEINKFEQTFFQDIFNNIPSTTKLNIDDFLKNTEDDIPNLSDFKNNPGAISLNTLVGEVTKLRVLKDLGIPKKLVSSKFSKKFLRKYIYQVSAENKHEILRHPEYIRYPLLCIYLNHKSQEIRDNLVDLLIKITHKMYTKSDRKVKVELTRNIKKMINKEQLLLI